MPLNIPHPIDQAMTDAQPPETITLQLPRPVFDAARDFIKGFGQALDAADASIKAGQKNQDAHSKMSGSLGDLAGFSDELNAASQSGMGLPPMQ